MKAKAKVKSPFFTWEIVDINGFGQTERGKVPGGWLVRTLALNNYKKSDGTPNDHFNPTISICFYPDAKHEWGVQK